VAIFFCHNTNCHKKFWYKSCDGNFMSAKKKLSKLFGISQNNLALLLNVKRSQLSMYELSLRSLPTEAIQKMAELLEVVQSTEFKTVAQSLTVEEMTQYHDELQKLLKENDYQQQRISRKIAALEEKCQNRAKLLQLLHHYDHKKNTETPHENLGRKLLQVASNTGSKNVFKMLDHQIQLQFLQAQAHVLRKELGE
jgi:transcriptional regulator with XRE-family HTH domain